MSVPSDYSHRMPVPDQVDDATAETLLTGGDPPPGLEPIATTVRAMRETANRPVRPRADLAQQMAAGVFTADPERYPGPALGPQGRGLGAAVGAGVRATAHRLAAAPRRVAEISLAAKVASVALAIGLLGIGSAGFAGVLPAPVQHRFDTVVESVTPYEPPRDTPPEGNPMGRDETGSIQETANPSDTDPAPGPGRSGASQSPEPSTGSDRPPNPAADPDTGSIPGAGEPGAPANPDPPGNGQPGAPANPGKPANPGRGGPDQNGKPGNGNGNGNGNGGNGNPGNGNAGNGNGNPGNG